MSNDDMIIEELQARLKEKDFLLVAAEREANEARGQVKLLRHVLAKVHPAAAQLLAITEEYHGKAKFVVDTVGRVLEETTPTQDGG